MRSNSERSSFGGVLGGVGAFVIVSSCIMYGVLPTAVSQRGLEEVDHPLAIDPLNANINKRLSH